MDKRPWQHHFHLMTTCSGRGACRYEPMPAVDSRGRQPRKIEDAWSIRLGWSSHVAGTTYALRLFLRALPGWLSPRRSQNHNQDQGTNALPSGENAVVTSGVDAALCVKEYLHVPKCCFDATHNHSAALTAPSPASHPHFDMVIILRYLALAWNCTFGEYLLLACKGCAHSLSLAARMPASLCPFRVSSVSLSLS